MSEVCNNVRSSLEYFNASNPESYTRILVDDRHKIIYCPVGKTGSTSIKAMMISQSKTTDFELQLKFKKVHNPDFQKKHGTKQLMNYPIEDIREKLRTYRKLIVVRHPLERIISAYKDKFIMTTYGYQRVINGDISQYSDQTGHINAIGFINMLAQSIEARSTDIFDYTNHHWNLQHNACHVCNVQYDYIAKTETLSSDQKYILDLFGASELPHGNTASAEMPALPTVPELLHTLSKDVIKVLMDNYRLDFDMFGYAVNITRDTNGEYVEK